MPSVSLQLPVAVILLGGGLLASFAGYRLLRTLLALYGFVGGVIATPLLVDTGETWLLIGATIAGGIVGAVLAIALYLAAVALLGAGLAAFVLNMAVEGDPDFRLVLGACVAGALLALVVRRHVLIAGTAVLGGWTTIVGAMALWGHEAAVAATTGDVSGVFPVAPFQGQAAFAAGWAALGLVGTVFQLRSLRRMRVRKSRAAGR